MAVTYSKQLSFIVDRVIDKVGKKIVLGTPLGAGKPNDLINAFYHRAKQDKDLDLIIATALTLERPKGKSDLEKRFLKTFSERVFGNYPDLDYELDRQKNQLPQNIKVIEFYFPAGKFLSNPVAQQNYISTNYTHVVRDMMDRGINVLAQMVSKEGNQLSLSCNADVSPDLVPLMRKSSRNVCIIAQVNYNLPFMYGGDAQVNEDFFDYIYESDKSSYDIFCPPKMSVSDADYMIGLYASSLIKDDGELQIGIGSLGDAIAYSLIQRHTNNSFYQKILKDFKFHENFVEVLKKKGELGTFKVGLFGATEMMVDSFMELYKSGILKKKVYDNIYLQRLINDGAIQENFDKNILEVLCREEIVRPQLTQEDFNFLVCFGIFREDLKYEKGLIYLSDTEYILSDIHEPHALKEMKEKCLGTQLKRGHVVHGGFFLGPKNFYRWLRDLPPKQRSLIAMKSVQKINQLYGHEDIDRLHRKNARFINTCMMMTLAGAVVSDGLEDGRIISGVGGQYNFVSMAQALPDGHSLLMLRSTRKQGSKLLSNIVYNYGHMTIPRHLRDIVITEYGIADIRGKTDSEIIKALLNICDSHFQKKLLSQAKKAGKIEKNYTIPLAFQNNYPESYQAILKHYKRQGLFPNFPFGTDFSDQEQKIGKALKLLKKDINSHKGRLKLVVSLLFVREKGQDQELLERMQLNRPSSLKERLYKRLLVAKFRELHY